jgi:O-methyltransferase
VELDLSKLNLRQIGQLADAALRAGAPAIAGRLYEHLRKRAHGESHLETRYGLAINGGPRAIMMLDVLEIIEKAQPRTPFVGEGLATWFKTLPFMDDAKFMALAEKHVRLLPAINWHWNLQTVVWAVEQVRRLDGDFVELGVFKGHTTHFIADYVDFADWSRRWWLYDTFEGIPKDQLDPGWEKADAAAYGGTFSYEGVKASFADFPNIDVIKGRVPEILLERSPDKIAFLHMDLNNATAEIQALDLLYDRIVRGGVIVFDDYVWAVSRAQYEAEKAWSAKRGLTILPLPTGQGVFVKP